MAFNFNVHEFINRFTDMIPYEVDVVIGGNLAHSFKTDNTKICNKNHHGKIYPTYSQTNGSNIAILEDQEAQKLSLPIQISVKRNPQYTVAFDNRHDQSPSNPVTHTNKDFTCHTLRLIDSFNQQVGFCILTLNPSGDISNKSCYYESYTGKHKIVHHIDICTIKNRSSEDKSQTLCVKEHITYTERYLEFGTETTVELYLVDGIITCITIKNKKTKTEAEIMMEKITDTFSGSNNPNGLLYLTRSIFDEKTAGESNNIYSSYESQILNEDLAWEFGSFYGCEGTYRGHTYIMTLNYSGLCIHTSKDGYNLYTKVIDLMGTKPFKDADLFAEFRYQAGSCETEFGRDEKYFEKVKHTNKSPLFITRTNEEGKEILVGYKGILFEEYSMYRGWDIRKSLEIITKNGTCYSSSFTESEKKAWDILIKLRDLGLTIDDNIVIPNLEEIALEEFKPFEEQFITPFTPIPLIRPIQYVRKQSITP